MEKNIKRKNENKEIERYKKRGKYTMIDRKEREGETERELERFMLILNDCKICVGRRTDN